MEFASRFQQVDKIVNEIGTILVRATLHVVEKLRPFVEVEAQDGQAYATIELLSDQNFSHNP